MANKLDKSLDEILSTHRRSADARGRGGSRRSARVGRSAAAPVGGVKKYVKTTKGGSKTIPTGPSAGSGESKIVVSNMPKDVNEAQIKEYFGKSVGPIRKVEISYGPNGVSRGIANITFSRLDGANKALTALNGLLVDQRPMKIEILVDASLAPAIPAPKGLSERIAQPKSQPKSAATTKATANGASNATAGRAGRRGRGRAARNPRPSKKTAEELDTEMADYFVNSGAATEGATVGGAAQPAANGDVMEDEIL